MKKTYIAPEMEIKKFSVEDIMTQSSAPLMYEETANENETVKTVNYNDLFGIDA